jgi:hypothetical protein
VRGYSSRGGEAYPNWWCKGAEAATSATKAGRYGVLARLIQQRFCYNRQSAALACKASVPVMFNMNIENYALNIPLKYELRFTRNALSGDFAANCRG